MLEALRVIEMALSQNHVFLALAMVVLLDTRGVRRAAVQALGAIGAVTVQHAYVRPLLYVLPVLVEVAVRDKDDNVRREVAKTLKSMEVALHPHMLSALVDALQNENAHVRRAAVKAVGGVGAEVVRHPEVLLILVDTLRDEDEVARWAAARALGSIGTAVAQQHPYVLSALVEVALRDTGDVRRASVEALGTLGAAVIEHPHVLSALVNAVQNENMFAGPAAIEILGAVGAVVTQHPQVLPTLVNSLKKGPRQMAAQALGRMMAQGVRIFKARYWGWRWQSVTALADQ
jgi:HEAT repeat protein